jgi:hypothetical protein
LQFVHLDYRPSRSEHSECAEVTVGAKTREVQAKLVPKEGIVEKIQNRLADHALYLRV